MPSIKLRTCARTPISIGSNQSSKSWALVQAAECNAADFVLLLPMAWSPPAWQRRNRLGWTTRRLRHFQFPPIPLRHPADSTMADRLLPSTAISLRSGSSPRARQALPTKPITERLRVLRLGKTEQHQVNVSPAYGIGQRRHRQGVRKAAHDFAVLEATDLVCR